ncbi:MAG: hypothetical protein IJ071_08405 [Ruminococcus sp.]|nr:hypothetical protein [Ruminococcus sp.]
MDALALIIILTLACIEIYCVDWIMTYISDRAEEKAEKRRAVYRRKAYQVVHARRTVSSNRAALWQSIEK